MIGIGVDIIEIDRIEKALQKNNGFIEKICTTYEQNYYTEKGKKSETVAGLFAAKEAVSKVLGKGVSGYSWRDIEIKHTANGQPIVVLHEGAREQANALGIDKILVSISHCKTYAVANAAGVKGD